MGEIENNLAVRPRIRPTLEWIEAPDDSVILLRPTGQDIRVNHPDRAFLRALDGSLTVAELERRFDSEVVRETLALMQGLGLLEDAAEEDLLGPEVTARFVGQLRYFGEVRENDGPMPAECQRRLAAAKVAVLGVGGLGGRVALDLASIGIGELWLADGDRVEQSNLNRQIQFDESDLGLLKVERTAARVRALNSATTVRTHVGLLEGEDEIAAFLDGADLVVDAADWPPHEIERRLNLVCFGLGIPYIAMSHYPPITRFGPLYVPGQTGCYTCLEAAIRRDHPLYDLAVEQRRGKPSPGPTLGPACGMTAGLVATDVMNHLTGLMKPRTLGAGYTFDLRGPELRRYDVLADPDCPVCGGATEGAGA